MKRDFQRLVDRMVENARAGVVMEQKILAWRVVEQQEKASADPVPVRKAG
jgi:hypothetical protein